ncbi:MAG: glycine cleavage system protein GcvH [Desulfovibrio sp.]|jgi:glycine cleavage system H protein|nr:glycine cleavage system protein GcvH [Desulfovibrio sp.]MBQ1330045.1 glycine cleavage system protein GcvH [Desulfovibrio sp.]MBQ1420161.1 glycine cleavage system protein GcvH [Desulfovibrio sp.]MBQ1539616.1 glycine cleavage system protein GcvH [Desulfovibrio sp.]MBQ1846030.1 glycine cleavage system protein GcvH [Desulfovibrio sp.]
MKSVNELNLPQDRKYTAEHVWFKMEGDLAVCGITDFAQDQLGEVAFVDVSAQGEHVEAGKEFGSVESVKSVNGLFMPVSGEIVEANAALEDDPALVNASCYGTGWIIKIKPDAGASEALLLDADAYKAGLN